ncbi:MAG: peptide chain release factor 1 [Candidatus Altiarchaeota archaeon]|nr:peptide chain release factor 1 [Candidatus Altiarchaeota archaeon]
MDRNLIEFKKTLEKLEKYRGKHTELVTVLIPVGYDINRVSNQLSQEQGTASNIKSKQTRKNVMTALEKMIQRLSLFKKTPEHGLAIFSGNVGDENNDHWVLESLIPPEPLGIRTYRCDQVFFVEPLKEMLKPRDVYGLIAIERREATVGFLKGKRIEVVKHLTSGVPGKFRAGGQSAARFERLIEGLAAKFYKRVTEQVVKNLKETKGILLGGPGPTKEQFLHHLPKDIQSKIIAIQDIGYSDEYGLKEMVGKSADLLAKTEIMLEKKVLDEFFKRIAKGEPVVYGLDETRKAFEAGSVELLILSESVDEAKMNELMEMADSNSIEIEFISGDSEEGGQFKAMGGVAAFLRY